MRKDGFYVQLHLHTSETSRCGVSPAAEMARACKAAGYDLIAVTDHFFNANIGCSPRLPWRERVDYLFRGYYAAKAVGDRIGLEVIRGWETYTDGPELLTYGLDAVSYTHLDVYKRQILASCFLPTTSSTSSLNMSSIVSRFCQPMSCGMA